MMIGFPYFSKMSINPFGCPHINPSNCRKNPSYSSWNFSIIAVLRCVHVDGLMCFGLTVDMPNTQPCPLIHQCVISNSGNRCLKSAITEICKSILKSFILNYYLRIENDSGILYANIYKPNQRSNPLVPRLFLAVRFRRLFLAPPSVLCPPFNAHFAKGCAILSPSKNWICLSGPNLAMVG